MFDVREIIRRLRLSQSERGIARDLKVARKTVTAYRRLAQWQGWLGADALPATEAIEQAFREAGGEEATRRVPSVVQPHGARVAEWAEKGVPAHAIYDRLRTEHDYPGSYSSVYRFVRSLSPRTPEGFVRIETDPGEEVQVDFGFVNRLYDPKEKRLRKAWVFVMTLSFSRHQYVEFVFDQAVPTFVKCHVNAFHFFGGVPLRVRIDNLKAGVIQAALYDPDLNKIYRECAEHYGFLITVCPPETPQHKGKVEAGVKYVKGQLIRGRAYRDLPEANQKALTWIMQVASQRVHGTTKRIPIEQYDRLERAVLKPLPVWDYEPCDFKKAKLHPDCHVVYEGSYYSAPFRLIGQTLTVRATKTTVQLYHEHALITAHDRAWLPGTRRTKIEHYPPEKAACVMATPVWCRTKAARIGPATSEVVEKMLSDHPLDRLRGVQAILSCEKTFGAGRLEKASKRALFFGALDARKIKTILKKGLEDEALPADAHVEPAPRASGGFPRLFARSAQDFFMIDKKEGGNTRESHPAA